MRRLTALIQNAYIAPVLITVDPETFRMLEKELLVALQGESPLLTHRNWEDEVVEPGCADFVERHFFYRNTYFSFFREARTPGTCLLCLNNIRLTETYLVHCE